MIVGHQVSTKPVIAFVKLAAATYGPYLFYIQVKRNTDVWHPGDAIRSGPIWTPVHSYEGRPSQDWFL